MLANRGIDYIYVNSFKQLMPGVSVEGTMIPANPYDARQMVDYLGENLPEAKALIWTLNLDKKWCLDVV